MTESDGILLLLGILLLGGAAILAILAFISLIVTGWDH